MNARAIVLHLGLGRAAVTSTLTPPLAPPNGTPAIAVFQVIIEASDADLVDVDLGVEADPALVGAAGAVVLDPVAVEDVRLPVARLDRDLHRDLAVGLPEDLADVVGEPRLSQAWSKWCWTTSRSETFARAERGSPPSVDASRGLSAWPSVVSSRRYWRRLPLAHRRTATVGVPARHFLQSLEGP